MKKIVCELGKDGLKAEATEQGSGPEVLCWSHGVTISCLGLEVTLSADENINDL